MQGFHFTVAKNTYTFNHLHMRTTPFAHAHYSFCTCALLLLGKIELVARFFFAFLF